MDRSDLANLTAFIAIAEQRSFRAAASRLRVTPSTLSHLMRQLEERLGVRLLHRTTRSVLVTDAGQRLFDRLRPAIDQIAGALENLDEERLRPLGRLRIYATSHVAAMATVAPAWERFLSTYPETQLELHVGDAPIDLVAEGFDVGIGPQDRAADGMIAVRVTGPMKMAVVGRQPTSHSGDRRAIPMVSFTIAAFNFVCRREAPPLRGHSYGMVRRCGFRWMAGLRSAMPIWPVARRSTGWASHSRSKLWPNRSYARANWSGCWRIGRPRSMDISSIFPGAGRSLPLCVPSLT
jgi:DNA-binding transcriptional LysR family regulator